MLALVFDVDGNRYALDARAVVEVLPFVRVTPVPHAPAGIAGLLTYRGTVVPVVDLSMVMAGRPSAASLSTRLVIVRLSDDTPARVLALMAERATSTLRRSEQEVVSSAIAVDEAPYLRRVTTDAAGLVQLVDVASLVPPAILDRLYCGDGES
jgi:chemotaxis-related protein WspB